MRMWLIVALWLGTPDRVAIDGQLWQRDHQLSNAAVSAGDLITAFLPLVKRANGEVQLKAISFNTF